ncbi:Bug family tripartite tricarboxylate transporter substrate binding protein [Variovorax sp. RA8]|uniref:Bug family tripartite tricarboxylate transporter substrate binding protein n=1 Tax=Variovorax sp. (strain JCM 16519 / RA8) TaxID=662548 RepID=UPI0013A594F4|nr:tripartite tricarboxylate transporter substrate binding protein [Variovorax sp. RA8]
MNRRAAIALACAICAAPAAAQMPRFPEKPVTFIVPFAAGSATDQLARALGVSFTEKTGQPVVVDNRGGAGGLIAAQAVARAAADGYTVLITTNTTQVANPYLYRKLPYDPVGDFAPVTGLGRGGQVLVVPASSPYVSVKDVLAQARAQPGKLSFGAGNSSSRVAGEMLKQLSNTDILYVPYKSNPQALTDLLGGQIDLMVIDTVTGMPQIESGKLRALGASTPRRLGVLPKVPTLDEAGVKGYDIGYWFAAYVPAKTSPTVVARLRGLLVDAVQSPQAKAFFDNTGTEPWTTTSDELSRFQAADAKKWEKVIKAANIQPE